MSTIFPQTFSFKLLQIYANLPGAEWYQYHLHHETNDFKFWMWPRGGKFFSTYTEGSKSCVLKSFTSQGM
jgi:hypothetical protein